MMSRMQVVGVLLLGVLLTFTGARTARAQTLDFGLNNQTGLEIVSVYLRPSHTHDGKEHVWSNDALGLDVLDHDAEARILFPGLAEVIEGTKWDLRVEDSAHTTHDWKGIDLESTTRITLFYDSRTGKTWAVTE